MQLELLGTCGDHLARVIRGRRSTRSSCCFRTDRLADLESAVSGLRICARLQPPCRGTGLAARSRHSRLGDRVRVLEVGGGTGGTTAEVLPRPAVARAEYVFTDVSTLFAAQAAEVRGMFPFFRLPGTRHRAPAEGAGSGRPCIRPGPGRERVARYRRSSAQPPSLPGAPRPGRPPRVARGHGPARDGWT